MERRTVILAGAAGLAATSVPTASASAAREHPNVTLIRRYYEAYGSGDLESLRQFFATDIRWTIPGHHPLAGTKVGATEVLAFFALLAKSGFHAEIGVPGRRRRLGRRPAPRLEHDPGRSRHHLDARVPDPRPQDRRSG